jgi:hypothetical protein
MFDFLNIYLVKGTVTGELGRLFLVTFAFMSIVLLSEIWHRVASPPIEWTRKFSHICCGIIVAFFPWIFGSVWSFVLLSLGLMMFFMTNRFYKGMKSIYEVKRSSLGDFYALAAIFILFNLSRDQSVFYLIAILTMTVADALAALFGIIYQRMTYSVEQNIKSLEGSLVFFLCTFLIVHIPLLLLTDVDKGNSILISLHIAFIVTCLEAVCLHGIDNFVVPLSTYYLLTHLSLLPQRIISELFVVQILIVCLISIVAWKVKFLTISGALTAQLFFYGAYLLGGAKWMIAPLIAFIMFASFFVLFRHNIKKIHETLYQVLAVFYSTAVASCLIILSHLIQQHWPAVFIWLYPDFFYVIYVGAIAGQLAVALYRFILRQQLKKRNWKSLYVKLIFLTAAACVSVIPVSLGVLYPLTWKEWMAALCIAIISPQVFFFLERSSKMPSKEP